MAETQNQPSWTSRALGWIHRELGLASIASAPSDTGFLFASRFVRMFAYGSSTLILALYFSALGHSDTRIGLFMTLTLLGEVFTSFPLTLCADALGRRRMLMLGGVMMAGAGLVFAETGNYWLLLTAAILGVISPSGNEIGPFRAVEEATLSQLVPPETRTDIFAWYIVAGTTATACGSLACGWFVQYLTSHLGWDTIRAYRVVFLAYACLGIVKFCIALCLSDKCEVIRSVQVAEPEEDEAEPLLNDTRGSSEIARGEQRRQAKDTKSPFVKMSKHTILVLLKLLPLFAVDSFSSGLVPFSLITYYIERKFHPPQGLLGSIMSVTWFFSAFSNIFASAIAKRIGLVKTMVFTHLPSAIFLLLFPLPSQLAGAMILLTLRSSLASMDQAPRSAFLAAVVLPEERTSVVGIVNMSQTLGRSAGPFVTGLLAAGGKFWIAFVVAGALKATYDLSLLAMFMNTRMSREEERDE
ncbi:MAG: para-aminobenzoate synthase, (PABA) [Geoglossum umbratile]|nr:MAG: para-aminobenzoate synthase, (PABA) [Geoglossum umbratile]